MSNEYIKNENVNFVHLTIFSNSFSKKKTIFSNSYENIINNRDTHHRIYVVYLN